MSSVFRVVAAAALGSFILASQPALAQESDAPAPVAAPLTQYGKLPGVEDAAISASGNRIAILTTVRGSRLLLVIED